MICVRGIMRILLFTSWDERQCKIPWLAVKFPMPHPPSWKIPRSEKSWPPHNPHNPHYTHFNWSYFFRRSFSAGRLPVASPSWLLSNRLSSHSDWCFLLKEDINEAGLLRFWEGRYLVCLSISSPATDQVPSSVLLVFPSSSFEPSPLENSSRTLVFGALSTELHRNNGFRQWQKSYGMFQTFTIKTS